MHLPVTSALAASTFLWPSSRPSNHSEPNIAKATLAPSLVVRQEAIAPPSSNGVVGTSVVTLIPSISPTYAVASNTATASTPTTTFTSTFTTMDTTVSASTSTAVSGTTQTINPTQSADVDSTSAAWATKGVIAGIVIGSVLGLLLLGVLIHFLYATYRGINVCNCFGTCCGPTDEENTRHAAPGARSDTAPGNTRPMSSAPLPLMMPQQVAEERRASKLQRKKG